MSGQYDSVDTATLFTSDGETFGSLPPMPDNYQPSRHCAVSLDGDDLFVTGGDRDETLFVCLFNSAVIATIIYNAWTTRNLKFSY